MSSNRITFAKLRDFLLDLGFTEIVVPDSHIAFRHADSDTDIMLPIYRNNQVVLMRHLEPVGAMLDTSGLLDRDEFDRWMSMSESSLASG